MHIQSYLNNPNVDLYSFCDLDEAKVKRMGEQYGVTRLYTDEETMLKGALLGAYDDALTPENAGSADIFVLALTPSQMPGVLEKFAPLLAEGALVTDTAGVKRPVMNMMQTFSARFPGLFFCGAHPMAGREFSGVAHSTASLYENASVLLVPLRTPLEKLALLKKMYTDAGAGGAVVTDAVEHDKMIAYTSQLAHVVSSAYVQSESAEKHYGYSAGSFRDMTRVARMNAAMWTELMTDNADFLSREIRALAGRLTSYADALDAGDRAELFGLLEGGNSVKLSVEKDRVKKLHAAQDRD